MKKIIFLTVLFLLPLFSCNKVETGLKENASGKEVTFSIGKNSIVRSKSTGIVEGTSLPGNFNVYGYVKPVTDITNGGYIMKDATYKNNGTPNGSNHYYWPKADNNNDINVKFVGYYPTNYSHSESSNIVTFAVDASETSASDCNDLLIAVNNNVHPQVANVPLVFKHTLAWLEFSAKKDENVESVTITNIQFSNALYTTGNLSVNLTDNTTEGTWSSKAGSLNSFASSTVLTNDYAILSDALIVPQDVPTSVTITFNITLKNPDDNSTIYYNGRTVTRTINTGNDANSVAYVSSFTGGHKYIYRIYVTADEVEFDVSVDDWTIDNVWQIWDHDATAYVEHFFDKASMLMA